VSVPITASLQIDIQHQFANATAWVWLDNVFASARVSTVVVQTRERSPPFLPLACDEGLAGFSLGVERIEGHFQSFLGRLARVNGASHCPPGIGVHLASVAFGLFRTKKSGPDHRVPVIRRAISERLS